MLPSTRFFGLTSPNCQDRRPEGLLFAQCGRAGCDPSDAVSECVRKRVRDGVAVDVDGVHVRDAVQRELDGEDAAAAADVEAGLALADAGREIWSAILSGASR